MNAPSTAFVVDPDDLTLPEDLPSPTADTGEVVVLLAEEDAQRGWGARAAVQLARLWGSEGLRVFLVDGDLSRAPLHGLIGLANTEGISDVILHGASPGRVAQRVEGSGFLFASAGTIVADVSEVYAHPRWSAVVSAFRESGSVFLLYLPREAVAPEIVALSDRVIRLADRPPGEGEDPGVIVLHPPIRETELTERLLPEADQEAVEEKVEETAGEVIHEAPLVSDPSVSELPIDGEIEEEAIGEGAEPALVSEEEAASASAEQPAVEQDGAPAEEPSWPGAAQRTAPTGSRRTRLIVLGLLLLILAFALVGERLGYFNITGLLSWVDADASWPFRSLVSAFG